MTVLHCKEPGCHDALSSHRRLIHGLLLWVTLLSLSQVVGLALFFTLVYPVQDKTEKLPSVLLIVAESENNGTIPWMEENSDEMLENVTLKQNGEVVIRSDGLYYLYTQISVLQSSPKTTYTVEMKWKTGKEDNVLLRRRFSKNDSQTATSGYMGRQFKLSLGDSISITCSGKPQIDSQPTETFFGIHMLQPLK
ncbi:tumor necrosis factor ligand superfamily member 18 [Amia ocellicauda]|uniref:tumor necrosis factor ligand superfamily member 18 n=1 Tax=Amia ocellicauda TaxID=2972642 RepID=UPI003463BB9C